MLTQSLFFSFFFFNDTATTEIYTLPYTTLFRSDRALGLKLGIVGEMLELTAAAMIADVVRAWWRDSQDRKSTRLNSSHSQISYAVFCLKKKKKEIVSTRSTQLNTRSQRPVNILY